MVRRRGIAGRSSSGPMVELLSGLSDLDVRVFDAVAQSPSPLLDRTMRPLSAAADHSKLWLAIAGGLAASGDLSLRRAAARGVLSLAVTSLVANQFGKRLRPRPRPDFAGIPPLRLRRQPTSSSFPSGHSASAAAFALGVGIEHRGAGYPLAGLAGAVGLSRVATGAHFPADVIAGFALGAGVALLGARIVPPVDDHRIVIPDPARERAAPCPRGDGLVLLVNPASGDGTGADVLDEVRRELPAAEIVELGPDDIDAVAAAAAARAAILGVAGGDGTVATVAAAALAADTPLAVFPGGTFNHFAKDIGAATVAGTVAAIRAGRITRVDVVHLGDDRLVLNTASIGAYPDFVRARSRFQRRISRPTATLRAAIHVARSSEPVRVRIGGEPLDVLFFFLGNSMYGAAGFVPGRRIRLDDGLIDVRFLEAGHRYAVVRLLGSLLTGRIKNSRVYREMQVPEFHIEADAPFRVAHDGEAGDEHTAARFRIGYRALRVYGTSVVADA